MDTHPYPAIAMSPQSAAPLGHVDASVASDGRPPSLLALFLITFDIKVGYGPLIQPVEPQPTG